MGHGLALSHPIFVHPNRADFEWSEEARPAHYVGHSSPLYPDGAPDPYRLAKFEHDRPSVANPTLVSHEGFFTDIPGLENLAEGRSAKALGSLSLARQGRWFYWGYSIDPTRMTDAAKDTLVNVLYYMSLQRDSQTVDFVTKTRAIFRVYTWLGRSGAQPYMRGVEEHLPGSLVPELRSDYTASFEGADAFVAKYLDYLYTGKPGMAKDQKYGWLFAADHDAMALGTPNHVRSSLERWVALAEEGTGGESGEAAQDRAEQRERARRCLARYVHPSIAPKGETWATWYARERSRLCFIDSTGFWWQADPRVLEREARQITIK